MATMIKRRPISQRGLITQGVVVSDKAKRTVIVQRDMIKYIAKYKRYARTVSKIAAHNPDEIAAKEGDLVEIAECRKMSKTKAWIVTKIITKGIGVLVPGQSKGHDAAQYTHAKEENTKEPNAPAQ